MTARRAPEAGSKSTSVTVPRPLPVSSIAILPIGSSDGSLRRCSAESAGGRRTLLSETVTASGPKAARRSHARTDVEPSASTRRPVIRAASASIRNPSTWPIVRAVDVSTTGRRRASRMRIASPRDDELLAGHRDGVLERDGDGVAVLGLHLVADALRRGVRRIEDDVDALPEVGAFLGQDAIRENIVAPPLRLADEAVDLHERLG